MVFKSSLDLESMFLNSQCGSKALLSAQVTQGSVLGWERGISGRVTVLKYLTVEMGARYIDIDRLSQSPKIKYSTSRMQSRSDLFVSI